MNDNKMYKEGQDWVSDILTNEATKICSKCGMILPIENFRMVKGQFHNPYYLGHCKKCEYKYQRNYLKEKNKITISDNVEILIKRKFKTINPYRILDINKTTIMPIGTDEVFVKLMDYNNVWLSNYGRIIRSTPSGKYKLLQGRRDKYGVLYYTLPKLNLIDGEWCCVNTTLRAAKAVVNEFVVNPDKANNSYIWHSGYNKEDCYYRNLYPLNQNQYKVVKQNFIETGEDSEDFIIKVMNEPKYQPDNWNKQCLEPVLCGIGYHGTLYENSNVESYIRWSDMMNRCYNKRFHLRQPQYKDCVVCEEWHNYSNFKVWYDENKAPGMAFDLDKDIVFKGNKEYSPATVSFVPHIINTLFLSSKSNRGSLPLGVNFDKSHDNYRAQMNVMGKIKKLGHFDSAIDAFNKYKEYKETFIKNMAEKYKAQIPYKTYIAMLNWEVESTD